ADAWIVPTPGADLGLVAVAVHGTARREDRRSRLDREAADDRLAGRDATQNAAGLVRQEDRLAVVAHAHLVGVLLATERRRRKSGTDLDPFDRVDAHQRRGEIAVEFAVDRRAEPPGNAIGAHLDNGADRGTAFADSLKI